MDSRNDFVVGSIPFTLVIGILLGIWPALRADRQTTGNIVSVEASGGLGDACYVS
jgi:hypothetical protein